MERLGAGGPSELQPTLALGTASRYCGTRVCCVEEVEEVAAWCCAPDVGMLSCWDMSSGSMSSALCGAVVCATAS